MKILGVEITQAQQAAGLTAMKRRFRAWEIQYAMERAGVDDDASMRAADALIQRERKAGRIRKVNGGGLWEKVS